jgi:hypothetical protein
MDRAVSWIAALAILGAARMAGAAEYIGSKGSLEAEVSFTQSGSDLILTLSNISSADVLQPTQVLTGVFFTLAGNPTLTPVSAELGTGSTVLFPPKGGVGSSVGDEWAFGAKLKHAPAGANDGIASLGLGLFSKPNFPGPKIKTPFNNLGFGITSAGDNSATGVKPVTGNYPLIDDSVVFTLAMPTNYVLGSITNVEFQYGTTLRGPEVSGILQTGPGTTLVPEPASLSLVACGIGLLVLLQMGRLRSRSR